MATAAIGNLERSLPLDRGQQRLSPSSYHEAAEGNHDDFPNPPSQNHKPMAELYVGHGEDAAPRTPTRSPHKKSASLRVNGFSKDNRGPSVIVEKYEDKDGEHLVSIRNAWDGNRSKTRRNSELVSGRRAGAGWEQSQYTTHNTSCIAQLSFY